MAAGWPSMKNISKAIIVPLEELSEWTFHQIRKTFGGKAAGLCEAKQLGLPIPDSWFIASDDFDQATFQLSTSFLPSTLFAVRSSGISEDSVEASFAGIFDTKLNVRKKDLYSAVQDVFESRHSERSRSYVRAGESLKMGVILEPMVEAKHVGIAFSRHPCPASVYENYHIVIETNGLRFSGTPESICSSVDAPWIQPLVDCLSLLRNFHGYEIDIEFAIDTHDRFVLLQQRPVTIVTTSQTLDLSHYDKKFKRALCSLDVELLIDGVSRYLAPYLELPFSLDEWMVMITAPDQKQELWLHRFLNETAISHLAKRIRGDFHFLDTLEKRYRYHTDLIRRTDYSQFDFFSWCEFMTPLAAHYYAPMLVVEALHTLFEIPEEDLFYLGTFEIQSLMDVLNDELSKSPSEKRFSELAKEFGFLKCHQPYETGYTTEELKEMSKELRPKQKKSKEKWDFLYAKYIQTSKEKALFEKFRHWLKIRNQEMEYLMFAYLQSRPLFEKIGGEFGVSVEELWNSSRAMILKKILKRSEDNLTIYHSHGKTHLSDSIRIVGTDRNTRKDLTGRKVYGRGLEEYVVTVAFKPEELKHITKGPHKRALVTGMTTPDFIPYLKRHFDALITDEGGILSHAAILARELSLPCITDTGFSTEILKDDMHVLIDFDRGQIRIKP